MRYRRFVALLAGTLFVASLGTAQTVGLYITQSDQEIRAYWTPERIANAKPHPLPTAASSPPALLTEENLPPSESRFEAPAWQSSVPVAPQWELISSTEAGGQGRGLAPSSKLGQADVNKLLTPHAVGTSGLYYTSTRLIPITADVVYPYSTVGKLFFTVPGGDAWCSASVISFRIVLTAGHCVSAGNSTPFFTNFLFVPAFRNGAAPFGTWMPFFVATTPDWFNGNGAVPNPADYAMFAMLDRAAIGQPVRRIAEAVGGFLGFSTGATAPNNIVNLGYPSNLDGNNVVRPPGGTGLMHQVFAGNSASGGNNTVVYGSDMLQGSSGGPWVQNFGVAAAGQAMPATNQAVGVNSYTTGLVVLSEGSSIFDGRFKAVFNGVCQAAPPNGTAAGNCQP